MTITGSSFKKAFSAPIKRDALIARLRQVLLWRAWRTACLSSRSAAIAQARGAAAGRQGVTLRRHSRRRDSRLFCQAKKKTTRRLA